MSNDIIYAWVEQHFGEQIKHSDHSDALRELVAAAQHAAYERGREDAAQAFANYRSPDSMHVTHRMTERKTTKNVAAAIRALPNPYAAKGEG